MSVGTVGVFVPGIPVSEGSTRFIHDRAGRARIVHVKQGELDIWRRAVAMVVWCEAKKAGWELPLDEPVLVTAAFYLPRPRTVKRDVPSVKPDLDKLGRAIGDALQQDGLNVLADDSRIIQWQLSKHYSSPSRPAGVELLIVRQGVPF